MKLKRSKWLLLVCILLLSSCANPNNDNPLNKDPNSDLREENGTENLSELSEAKIDELYSYIAFPEWYSMKKNTVDAASPYISEQFIDAIVKHFELDKYDLRTDTHYQLEYLQDAPRIPYSEVHGLYEKMYGKADKLPEKLHFPAKGIDFIYEEASDSYVLSIWQGDGNEYRNGMYYRTDYTYEQDGETLYIYDKFAQYCADGKGSGFAVYGGNHHFVSDPHVIETTDDPQDKQKQDDPSSLYYKLFNGLLDGKLPTYKHTYKLSENGNYYWVSTEPVQ